MVDTSIYNVSFLRHAESVGNAEDRFQGHADFPLTERGRTQARSLAERWKVEGVAFDQCITSPLLRARQTAEIICEVLRIPIESDPDWMEINNWLVSGLTLGQAEFVSPRPDFVTPYTHFGETGESRWELYLRGGRAIQHILDRSPGRYLVAAHGGILNMTLYAILGIPAGRGSCFAIQPLRGSYMSLRATIGAWFNSMTVSIRRKLNKSFGIHHE